MAAKKSTVSKTPSRRSKTVKKKSNPRVKPTRKTKGAKATRSQPTREIATIFSVADRTVHGWVRRGCPHDKGKAPIGNRFDEAEVAAWLKANHISTCQPGRPVEGDSKDLRSARLRKENALAAKYELQVERERGSLVSVDDVRSTWSQIASQMRNRWIGLGAAVSPMFPDVAAELEEEIDRRVKEILFEISDAGVSVGLG